MEGGRLWAGAAGRGAAGPPWRCLPPHHLLSSGGGGGAPLQMQVLFGVGLEGHRAVLASASHQLSSPQMNPCANVASLGLARSAAGPSTLSLPHSSPRPDGGVSAPPDIHLPGARPGFPGASGSNGGGGGLLGKRENSSSWIEIEMQKPKHELPQAWGEAAPRRLTGVPSTFSYVCRRTCVFCYVHCAGPEPPPPVGAVPDAGAALGGISPCVTSRGKLGRKEGHLVPERTRRRARRISLNVWDAFRQDRDRH